MAYNISQNTRINILNEKDLHFKVLDFMNQYLPNAIIIPGLGEHQITPKMRCESKRKGYVSGTPDILILNNHRQYNGCAIELKTPMGTGILSDNQATFLDKLDDNNYEIIISNNYEELILKLHEYFKGIIQKTNL